MTQGLKFLLLISFTLFCKSELQAQYFAFNEIDTFYFFKEYSYHLNSKSKDTSLLYLKLDLKTADIAKTSSQSYNGIFEFAHFSIDKKNKLIKVDLFDINKVKIKSELYSFNPKVIKTEETYFLSLAGKEKKLIWKTIETTLHK